MLVVVLLFPITSIAQPVQGVMEAKVALSPRSDALDLIIKELRAARQSVDVAMFYLSHDDLVDALCNLSSRRGIRVRVVTDHDMTLPARRKTLERLMAYGVAVHAVKIPGQGKMHLKCAVIDDETVITGAANWTKMAFEKNVENVLVIRSPEFARRYVNQMDRLLEGSEPVERTEYEETKLARVDFPRLDSPPAARPRDRLAAPRSRAVRDVGAAAIYFSPDRSGADALIEQIRSANEDITIGMYLFTDKQLVDALVSKAEDGDCPMFLLVDSTMMKPVHMGVLYELQNAGVEIHYTDESVTSMHLKALIIDRRHVWTGSANWTTGALDKNIEDLVHLESADLAKYYLDYLAELRTWAQAFMSPNDAGDVTSQKEMTREGYLVGLPPTGPRTNWSAALRNMPFEPVEAQVAVRYLPDEDYFPILIDMIRTAHQSILITMFALTELKPSDTCRDRLIKELERAAQRGVYVRLTVNSPISEAADLHRHHSEWAHRLRSKGIDMRLGSPPIGVHDKLVIVDLAKVLIGSHNWTEGALSGDKVYESSALVILPRQEIGLAEYSLSRVVVEDMRSRAHWEEELRWIRRLDSVYGPERARLIEQLESGELRR